MKKLLWGIALTLMAFQSCTSSSQEVIIKATFDTPFTGTVYLGHIQDQIYSVDSILLDHETNFTFRLLLDTTDCYRISMRPYRCSREILTEPGGEYLLSYNDSTPAPTVTVQNGKEQVLLNEYESIIKPINSQMMKLSNAYSEAIKNDKTQQGENIQKELGRLFDQYSEVTIRYIDTCPQTFAALKIASNLLSLNYPEWKKIYEQMDTVRFARSYLLRELKQKCDEAKSIWIEGMKAPQFTTTDLQGNPVSLNQFKGEYLLLDFWAPWCKPCRARSKELKNIFPQLQSKGINICAINVDDKRDKWLEATQEDDIAWFNTSEMVPFRQNEIVKAYKVKQLPSLFLIDANGIIIKQSPDVEYLLALPDKQ